MLRSFFIFYFICCYHINSSTAQTKGYEYADSSLLENTGDSDNTSKTNDATDTVLYKTVINIPGDSITAWKTDKNYAYVNHLDSLLKCREKEEKDAYRSDSENNAPSFLQNILSSGFVQAFFWMIAAAIVLFILYKLFLNKGLFRRNTSSVTVKEFPEEQHDIKDASDYEALIRQSYKLADYRMAVRWLFLKTLRQLTDKGLLHHSVDKTNFQYVQEIAPDKKKDFASLVLNYEYVWYGNLKISREQYDEMEKKYQFFYNKIG